jgi:hypothetical protein
MPSHSDCQEIEELAGQIAGDSKNPIVLECARAAAEAHFDLCRVRHTRVAMIDHALGKIAAGATVQNREPDRTCWPASKQGLARTAEAVRRLLPELQALNDYERRAWSRRESSLRRLFERGGQHAHV